MTTAMFLISVLAQDREKQYLIEHSVKIPQPVIKTLYIVYNKQT